MNYYKKNRNRLFEQLENNSMMLLHSGNPQHKTTDQFYPFKVSKNFYYLTGIVESNCTLLLVKTSDGNKEYLFVDETTDFMRQWVGEKISIGEASQCSDIQSDNIMYNELLDSFANREVDKHEVLYLDLYQPTKNHLPIGYIAFERYLKFFSNEQIQDINKPLSILRMFKNDYEIENIKKAIRITNEGIKRMMKEVKYRFYENQVEADFMHEIALNGSRVTGFDTILASGMNATILHYEYNNQKIERDALVLCDLGAEWNEYSADISRTFPSSGQFTERQKEIYEIVLKVNKETIQFVKPGVTWEEVNSFAKNLLTLECKRIDLLKNDQDITEYYNHSIGHFLGLDVHDVGQYKDVLQEGMVITIEPGLYIKDEAMGIRIEDNVLITKNGCINLSSDIIKEVDDIERFMR